MILAVSIFAILLLVVAAFVRAGTASLVRTPRADALKAEAEEVRGSGTVVRLLDDRITLQPSLGTTVTFLIVLAVIPLTWALTDTLSGPELFLSLVAMAIGIV